MKKKKQLKSVHLPASLSLSLSLRCWISIPYLQGKKQQGRGGEQEQEADHSCLASGVEKGSRKKLSKSEGERVFLSLFFDAALSRSLSRSLSSSRSLCFSASQLLNFSAFPERTHRRPPSSFRDYSPPFLLEARARAPPKSRMARTTTGLKEPHRQRRRRMAIDHVTLISLFSLAAAASLQPALAAGTASVTGAIAWPGEIGARGRGRR